MRWLSSVLVLLVLGQGCSDSNVGEASAAECLAPRAECGGVCVNPMTDPSNCSACGQACEPGQYCSEGACSDGCTGSLTACGQSCVNPLGDPEHCGQCDRVCWTGLSCVQGACVVGQGSGGAAGTGGTSSSGGTPNSDPRVRVSNSEFSKCGQRIFMNGVNTPWNNWNDFGGDYDRTFWSNHYRDLHDAGVNSSRVWITCSGEVGIDIAADGTVLGATAAHWADLDSFFAIAEEQQIHVMATLMSFDHFDSGAEARWDAWIASDANIDSFVENYLIPFLERYGQSPYLWSIDLINEPDWVYEESNIPFDRLRAYFARAARAIHQNSEVLVTVGMASPKHSANCSGCEQLISDAELRKSVDDPAVYLDFYSPHYYDWVGEQWGNTLHRSPALTGYPTDKPLMIGEFPARGTAGYTLTEDIKAALAFGWKGTMPWTSNGVDRNGGFAEVSVAATAFRDANPSLVFPACQ